MCMIIFIMIKAGGVLLQLCGGTSFFSVEKVSKTKYSIAKETVFGGFCDEMKGVVMKEIQSCFLL